MRQRPSSHTRNVRTRFGRRKRLINPHIPKRKVVRASKLRRDIIRKDLVMEGPYKEGMVRVMEKYPSVHRAYIESGFPVVETVPDLHIQDKGRTKKLWGLRVPYMEQGPHRTFQHNKILLDETLFKKAIAEERPFLGTRIPATPKTVTKHELTHAKDADIIEEYMDHDIFEFGERMADLSALFDERKLKVPEDKKKDKFGKVFSEDFK